MTQQQIPLIPLLQPGERARIWRRRNRRHYDAAPRRLPELNVLFCVDGRIQYFLNDEVYTLGPRSLLLANPGDAHFLIRETDDADLVVAGIAPDLLEPVVHPAAPLNSTTRPDQAPRRLTAEGAAELEALADTIIAAPQAALEVGIAWWLHRVHVLASLSKPAPQSSAHPAVARAARLLRTDPAQTIAAVATQSGLTETHLGQVFRAETGMTLVQYRTARRVELAARLLRADPKMPLLDLALAAGFNDYSSFYRACQRVAGARPKDLLVHFGQS